MYRFVLHCFTICESVSLLSLSLCSQCDAESESGDKVRSLFCVANLGALIHFCECHLTLFLFALLPQASDNDMERTFIVSTREGKYLALFFYQCFWATYDKTTISCLEI